MAQFIYEVTVDLPAEQSDKALRYMRDKHIGEVLQHPAFSRAEFFVARAGTEKTCSFTTHYYVSDEAQFANYEENYGREMRTDFMNHFGTANPQARRRLLEPSTTFEDN